MCRIYPKKLNMTQSTVSHYLMILERAGLLISTRIGKWTYYKRNEEVIKKFSEFASDEL